MAENTITPEMARQELARRELAKRVSNGRQDSGFTGIGQDIVGSLTTAPQAGMEFLKSIPETAKGAYQYGKEQPWYQTAKQLPLAVGEDIAGLLSLPQSGARYLARKFAPESRITKALQQTPTPFEFLQQEEEQFGLSPKNEQEQAMRSLMSLVAGGKGLSKLPGAKSRIGAITAEEAGRGEDPLHAALLSLAGESVIPGARKTADVVQKTGQAAKTLASKAQPVARETLKNIPEITGSVASSALESMADLASKAHIPGAQPTLGALGAYIKYISKDPEKFAQQRLFKDITPELLPLINERLEAANRLGLEFLTPAEATLSPFEAAKQGEIGKTSTGSRLLFEKGRERSQSEQSAIENLQQKIYDPKDLAPEKKAAYDEAMAATVPDEFIAKWKEDPVVEAALKQLEKKPTYKRAVKNIPENSFEYWNIVKRIIADFEKEEAGGMKKFSSDEATKTRNEMVAEMDKIQPEYKTARKIAEREFTRRDIENFFDKRNMTGNEFAKFMKSKKQFNKLLDKLEPYPEAQQALKDMKLLFGDLIPSDPSIRTAAQMKKTSMWDSRNKLDAFKRDLDERFGKKHDVAAVNLMTDPKWIEYLVKYLEEHKKS